MKTTTMDNVNRPGTEGGALAKPAEWWHGLRTFLTEVRNELKRVSWPSSKEVYATTLVVILFSVAMGLYLWLIDLILTQGLGWVYGFFGRA